MLEREWIIKAIEKYREEMYDDFYAEKIVNYAKIDEKKNNLYFIQKYINEDEEKSGTHTLYNLDEFIKDCQEKIPIALEIEKKYGGFLIQYGTYRMAFILDIYKQAQKLKAEAKEGK